MSNNLEAAEYPLLIQTAGKSARSARRLKKAAAIARDEFASREPPSAAELGVDVTALPPQRARLLCFMAWRDRTAEEVASLDAGRAAALEAMGVSAVTETRLRKLIEADTSNFLQWMKSGAAALTRKDAREFEREQIGEKLAGDERVAEVAHAAFDRMEAEIDAKLEELTILEERVRWAFG